MTWMSVPVSISPRRLTIHEGQNLVGILFDDLLQLINLRIGKQAESGKGIDTCPIGKELAHLRPTPLMPVRAMWTCFFPARSVFRIRTICLRSSSTVFLVGFSSAFLGLSFATLSFATFSFPAFSFAKLVLQKFSPLDQPRVRARRRPLTTLWGELNPLSQSEVMLLV